MSTPHLLCIGLSHHTAPLALRERLALDAERQGFLLARCGCGDGPTEDGLSELAVLSTCNRTEIYAAAERPDAALLEHILAEASGLPRERFAASLYRRTALDAAGHLLRVAAGLDSLVPGESQILGQVADAHVQALRHGSSGPLLSRLFQTALRAGKRARSETGIARRPASVSSAAVAVAAEVVPDLAAARVLVVGAGEMAELAVEALRKRGAASITVLNRTPARARALAARWQAQAQPLERLAQLLPQADVLVCSTGAPHLLLGRPTLAAALAGRAGRPLVILDIAVPRDVDPAAADLPGVRLVDLDHLQARAAGGGRERLRAVPQVEAIVEQELACFAAWLDGLSLRPLVAALHRKAEGIRQRELERSLRRLPQLSSAERARVERLSRALVRKLLREPTLRLLHDAPAAEALHYAEIARQLFGLDGDGAQRGSQPGP